MGERKVGSLPPSRGLIHDYAPATVLSVGARTTEDGDMSRNERKRSERALEDGLGMGMRE